MTVPQLKDVCKGLSLKVGGAKGELQVRVRDYIESEQYIFQSPTAGAE